MAFITAGKYKEQNLYETDPFYKNLDERQNEEPRDFTLPKEEEEDSFEFVKGLKSGVDQTQALAGGLKAAVGSAVGNREWVDDGLDYYKQQMEEASLNAPRTAFEDEWGEDGWADQFTDFTDWLSFTAGNLVPSMVGMLGTGGLGGAVFGGVAKAATTVAVKKSMRDRLQDSAEGVVANQVLRESQKRYVGLVAKKYSKIGTVTGGAAFSAGSGVGESFGRIVEETGLEDPATAFSAGIAMGALDLFGVPFRAFRKMFPNESLDAIRNDLAEDVLNERSTIRKVFDRVITPETRLGAAGSEALKSGVLEGVTEVAQESLSRLGVKWASRNLSEEDQKKFEGYMFGEDAMSSYIHAMAAGAVGGTFMGGITGAVSGPSPQGRFNRALRDNPLISEEDNDENNSDTPTPADGTPTPPDAETPSFSIEQERERERVLVEQRQRAAEAWEAAQNDQEEEESSLPESQRILRQNTLDALEFEVAPTSETLAEASGVDIGQQLEILDVMEERGEILVDRTGEVATYALVPQDAPVATEQEIAPVATEQEIAPATEDQFAGLSGIEKELARFNEPTEGIDVAASGTVNQNPGDLNSTLAVAGEMDAADAPITQQVSSINNQPVGPTPQPNGDDSITQQGMLTFQSLVQKLSGVGSTSPKDRVGGKQSDEDLLSVAEAFGATDVDSSPELKTFSSVLVEAIRRGLPRAALDSVAGFYGFDGLPAEGNPTYVPAAYSNSTNTVVVNKANIREAVTNATAKKELLFAVSHELFHALDAAKKFTSEMLGMRVKLTRVDGTIKMDLDSLTGEMYKAYFANNELGKVFKYPFDTLSHYLENTANGDLDRGAKMIRQELFAQAGAVFTNNPKLLKKFAPQTYKMMQDIQADSRSLTERRNAGNTESKDATDGERTEVQGDVRTPPIDRGDEAPNTGEPGRDSEEGGRQAGTDTGVEGQSDNQDGNETGRSLRSVAEQFEEQSKQPEIVPGSEPTTTDSTVEAETVPQDQESNEEAVGETQSRIKGLQPIQLPVDELSLSQDVPQFKTGANDEGVVERLGGTFDPTGVGPIIVWERNDGRKEVISGRHRFDLAKRSGEKTILSQVFREADGFTVEQAAILDAELNLRDGQGQVKDYVNYFQADKITKEEAVSRGLLGRATGKRAYAISTDGSEELITAHRNDQITDAEAEAVALNAPGNTALQAAGLKALINGSKAIDAVNVMKAVMAVDQNAGGGGQQDSMFDFDDSAMQTAVDMAKIVSKKQRQITADLSAITGASKKPEVASKYGVDVKDSNALKGVISDLKAERLAWDKWHTNPELIAEINSEMNGESDLATPAEKEEFVPKAKRNKNFESEGEYDVAMQDGTVYQIYYDAQRQRWDLGSTEMPGLEKRYADSLNILGIASNKKEAIEWLVENHDKSKKDSDFQEIVAAKKYLYQKSKGKVRGKSAITKVIKPSNADKQLPALAALSSRHPNALDTPESWLEFERDLTGNNETLRPPHGLINLYNNMDEWAEVHGKLSKEQILAADSGLKTAQKLGKLYESGKVTPDVTAKLMFWGMMSRMLTASAQEAGFVDMMTTPTGANRNPFEDFVDRSLSGEFTKEDVADWKNLVPTLIEKGSFGKAGTSNANDFGKFLEKMSVKDDEGVTKLQKLHNLIADRSISSIEVRRQFQGMTDGIGIDNKVFSFVLLMTGREDVVILDRIQLNTMWDAGRYGKLIYDDIADNFNGLHGLARYEAIEAALSQRIGGLYQRLGRGSQASVGRYHWESWVLNSGQVVAHPTMQGIVADVRGEVNPYAFLGAPEGKQNMYRYGAIYARDDSNKQYFLYSDSKGEVYRLNREGFSAFVNEIKKPKHGIIPKKFKVSEYDKGFPWYEADGVNRENLDTLLYSYAERKADAGEYAVEGTVQGDATDGAGQELKRPSQAPDPDLQQGVQDRIDRKISAKQLNDLQANKGRFIQSLTREQAEKIITLPSDAKAINALTKTNREGFVDKEKTQRKPSKETYFNAAEPDPGERVAGRLDIPANNPDSNELPVEEKTSIVTIHLPRKNPNKGLVGKRLGYRKTLRLRNGDFGVHQTAATGVGTGSKSKTTFAAIEGSYVPATDEENLAAFLEAIDDPEWTQVSMNPRRHSHFYRLDDQYPVVTFEDVIQVGNFVIAKNVNKTKYPEVDDFLYMKLEGKHTPSIAFNLNDEVLAERQTSSWLTKYFPRKWVAAVQDKFERWETVENAMAATLGKDKLGAEESFRDHENLMHSKLQVMLEKFGEEYIEPIALLAKQYGFSADQIGAYLLAKHAPERNAVMKEKEQELRDKAIEATRRGIQESDSEVTTERLQEQLELLENAPLRFENNGSGVSNEDAAALISAAEEAGTASQFEEIASKVYKMLDDMRQNMVDKGLLDEESKNDWEDTYDFYVPLRGFKDPEDSLVPGGSGAKGFSITGPESMKARGRLSLPENPLLMAFKNASEKIIRGEKNTVSQRLLKLVERFSSTDSETGWTVYTAKFRAPFPKGSKEDLLGETMSLRDMKTAKMQKFPNLNRFVQVKRGGQDFFIEFRDPILNGQLHDANSKTLNDGNEVLESMLKKGRIINNFRRKMIINYNPSWGLVNPMRDVETGLAFLLAEQSKPGGRVKDKDLVAKVFKGFPKAFKAYYDFERNKEPKTDEQKETRKYIEEYVADGAPTGLATMKDLDELRKDFEQELGPQPLKIGNLNIPSGIGARTNFRKYFNIAIDWIEAFNQSSENAIRLSTYIEARKAGTPRLDSATLAKDLTTNFNRKGEYSSQIDAFYLFFNAAIQGNVNLKDAIVGPASGGDKAKLLGIAATRRLFYGLVAFGLGRTIMNALIADEDDDGESTYKDYNSYQLQTSATFMAGDWAFGIPLPYGWGWADNMGRLIGEQLLGLKEPEVAAVEALSVSLHHFSPRGFHAVDRNTGTGGQAFQAAITLVPDVGSFFVEQAANINFFGSPIVLPTPYTDAPVSSTSKRGTLDTFKSFVKTVNSLTGGSQQRSGAIDISADRLQHIFDFTLGGLGRFGTDLADTVQKSAIPKGEELKGTDIPVWSRFYYNPSEYKDQFEYYDNRRDLAQEMDEWDSSNSKGREALAARRSRQYYTQLNANRKATDKKLKSNRKSIRAIETAMDSATGEYVNRLKANKKSLETANELLYDKFNKRYRALK